MRAGVRVSIALLAWLVSILALLKTLVIVVAPYALASLSGRVMLSVHSLWTPVVVAWFAFGISTIVYWIFVHALLFQFGRGRNFWNGPVIFCLLVIDILVFYSVFNSSRHVEMFWFGPECLPHLIAILLLFGFWHPQRPRVLADS